MSRTKVYSVFCASLFVLFWSLFPNDLWILLALSVLLVVLFNKHLFLLQPFPPLVAVFVLLNLIFFGLFKYLGADDQNRSLMPVICVLFILYSKGLKKEVAIIALLLNFLALTAFSLFASTPGSNQIDSSSSSGEDVRYVSLLLLVYFLFFQGDKGLLGLVDRLRIYLLASISVLFDNRVYMFLAVCMSTIADRFVLRWPFAFGALVSILFPVLALVYTYLVEPYLSLYSRTRQLEYMWSVVTWYPETLVFGYQAAALKLPEFLWFGDTKVFGSVFQFGIPFVVMNIVLIFLINKDLRLSKFQSFLLGLLALGYLGANPLAFSIIFMLSILKW